MGIVTNIVKIVSDLSWISKTIDEDTRYNPKQKKQIKEYLISSLETVINELRAPTLTVMVDDNKA